MALGIIELWQATDRSNDGFKKWYIQCSFILQVLVCKLKIIIFASNQYLK